MTEAQGRALAESAIKAAQAASAVPLDVMVIVSDASDDIVASAQFLASLPRTQGDQLRTMLRHYCSALKMVVEQCTEPEELIEEIGRVLRAEALGRRPS